MDPNSSLSRLERTMWTVWGYITGAVTRFLRSEPVEVDNNELNSMKESSADSKSLESGRAQGDTSAGAVSEDKPQVPDHLLRPSLQGVAWEICTTDNELGSAEEELKRGNVSSEFENVGSMKEEQLGHTEKEYAGLLFTDEATDEDAPEKTGNGKFSTCRQDETSENKEEHMDAGLGGLTEDVVTEGAEKSDGESGPEERSVSAATLDDREKLHETIAMVQVKEEQDEEDLKEEDTQVKLSTEEEDMLRGEVGVQGLTQEAKNCEAALKLENKPDEETNPVKNDFPVCEEMPDVSKDEFSVAGQDVRCDNDKAEADRVPVVIKEENISAEEEKGEDISEEEVQKYISDDEEEDKCIFDNEKEEQDVEDDIMNYKEVNDDINDDEEGGVEERINKTTNDKEVEASAQKNNGVVTEVWKEENSLTQSFICSEKSIENTQDHKTEFTDKQADVVVTSKQTTAETDSSTQDISEGEKCVDNDQVEEEWLSSEADNKGYMGKNCATTSVTVNLEGETEEEISREFKNIPLWFTEGQVAVPQELNAQACEETQEGIPEYNNELRLDENTTQWFQEKGNCEEIQITQLPEQEESKDQDSFKNKGAGAHCSLLREKQVSTEESECSFDSVVEDHSGKQQLSEKELCAAAEIQESGHSFEEGEEDLSESSMKTDIGSAEETEKVTEELQDGADVAEFRMDEDFKEASGGGHETNGAIAADEGVRFAGETLKYPEVNVENMTEVKFPQESVNATHTEENHNKTSSQQEETDEFNFMKYSVKTKLNLLDDSSAEHQDVEEKHADGDEKEDEMQGTRETMCLQVAGLAAELITGQTERESTAIASSLHLDTEEIINQSLYRASEMNETKISDTEAADESKTNTAELFPVTSAEETTRHVTQSESYHKETRSLITEHQDVIDEDILDLWIETAMSLDTPEQHVSEPEPQMDTMTDPLIKDHVKSEKEKLKELDLGESESVSDTTTPSSALQSGYLDEAFSDAEWTTLTSISSLQGIHEVSPTMSELSESQGEQTEETAKTLLCVLREEGTVGETGSDPDSGVSSPEAKHPYQEFEKSEEKPDDRTEAEMEVTVRACGNTEEADLGSQIKMSPIFQVKTEKFQDEFLEATASDWSDGIKLTESRRCDGDSESSLEESDIRGKPWTESEIKMLSPDEAECRRSEDVTDSSPALSRADVVEEQATKPVDQIEVNSPALDFTVRKSRIAVKNPRIRPPTNHRSLIHMPSADPTPSAQKPVKVLAGVPLGGLGIGIKLPGLGAGLPVLKKTQQVVRNEDGDEVHSHEPQEEEVKSETPKQDEVQHKPRWMPPGHPGFGNPLMSELKNKLKKTPKE